MQSSQEFDQNEHWVIWNGSLGILDTVTIGQIALGAQGYTAWLDEPYDMVGPFDFDELQKMGVIHYEACLVMSRTRWQLDQAELRKESARLRREAQERINEAQAKYNNRKTGAHPETLHITKEKQHRETLNLPLAGALDPSQIKSAFRRLAQKAHPDTGGDHEQFIQITEARDALLARHR